MSRRLSIRFEAEADIIEAASWYEGRDPGLGTELLTEIRAAIQRATEHPLSYPCLRKRPEVRRILSRRFPYRIFFIVRPDAIVTLPFCTPRGTIATGEDARDELLMERSINRHPLSVR